MTTSIDADADHRRLLRQVLAEVPKGVTVVAADGPEGPVGMTATAVTSLSLRPPLILVCMRPTSRTLGWLRQRGRFSVSLLRADQQATSQHFAGRPATCTPDDLAYRTVHGAPVLRGALAWLTCRLHAEYPGGDHLIVVGAVTGASCEAGEPLVWHRGGYRAVTDLTAAPPPGA